ncbi:NAD(P)-binding protein [Aureobasidium pullulans]|uniref:NAD(P)-binding protein n=1 Tax=Aureobasidium pullulans TaxID=5580 RepID=A0A4S9D082_AURPU|nr:NAD(P)-binding protein [Aureobasidium pullulans]
MPVPLIQKAILDGLETVPNSAVLLKLLPVLLVLYLIRRWFQGASNTSERTMHGKVVIITGGTSGIGAEVARDLATRGAQLVLLTQHALDDFFLVSYIEELRDRTNNELITAAHVDLSSLHSIRQFATKWVDNAPPRRLDMIILCANTMTPKGGKIETTNDDVEINWGLNYLANFHLLSILSPAIRAQPPDRDVRVIMATCSSYIGGSLPVTGVKEAKIRKKERAERFDPYSAYASSKLALMTFAQSFQKHLSAYARPDKNPMNAHVIIVDPGQTRTPGMRRYLTWGSLTGLVLYLLCYPLWYIILKSPAQGAQSFLYAAMEAQWGRGNGGWLIKECREIAPVRRETLDEELQKQLWEYSENMIQEAEKRGAAARAKAKAEEKMKPAEPKKPEEKKTGSRRSKKA